MKTNAVLVVTLLLLGLASELVAQVTRYAPKVGQPHVDFVLPSRDLRVLDSGVLWPKEDPPLREDADQASRHRLVWVDVTLP